MFLPHKFKSSTSHTFLMLSPVSVHFLLSKGVLISAWHSILDRIVARAEFSIKELQAIQLTIVVVLQRFSPNARLFSRSVLFKYWMSVHFLCLYKMAFLFLVPVIFSIVHTNRLFWTSKQIINLQRCHPESANANQTAAKVWLSGVMSLGHYVGCALRGRKLQSFCAILLVIWACSSFGYIFIFTKIMAIGFEK